MKSILACVFLLALTKISLSDDNKCKNDFTNFLKCAKDQFPEKERKSMKDEVQKKCDQCFADAGCTPPAHGDQQETDKEHKQHGNMEKMLGMSEKVKKCMKRKVLEKFQHKFEPCLKKKGVEVNFNTIADHADMAFGTGATASAGAGASGHGAEMGIGIKSQFNVVKAVDKCSTDKYNGDPKHSKIQDLESCLHKAKMDEMPRVCTNLKPCLDKVNGDCKSKGQAKFKALCECMKEEEKKIAAKLAEKGKQDKVSIQDLIHTVADDQDLQDVSKIMNDCYAENGEKPSPFMQMALSFISGGGGTSGSAGAKLGGFTVSVRQCTIMSDMLNIDANDNKPCDGCK